MREPDPKGILRGPPWGGAIQGSVQALIMVFFMWLARSPDHVSAGAETASAFALVLATAAAFMIGLGAIVDRRRRDQPLPLAAPKTLRALVISMLALLFTAFAVGNDLLFWLALLMSSVLGLPLFVVIDRLLGPAWVLGATLIEDRARRAWDEREVIEADDTRALLRDETGETEWVRSEAPLELGPGYFVLARLEGPTSPYRSEPSRRLVLRAESPEARAARRSAIGTAALGLVSGLVWLTLPFFLYLGQLSSRV